MFGCVMCDFSKLCKQPVLVVYILVQSFWMENPNFENPNFDSLYVLSALCKIRIHAHTQEYTFH